MPRSETAHHEPRRARRVCVDRETEVCYWAERLGVYPSELRAAVGAVGDDLDDLWRYLDAVKHEHDR